MKKIKCGVITFHRAHNYGAILQTYALQKTMESFSVECEVIDYRSKFIEKYYKPITLFNLPSFKRSLAILIFNGQTVDNKKAFHDFTKKSLKISDEKYYDNDSLSLANERYDFFISGSDQIWNYITAGHIDESYFLNFVDDAVKKNAYAPSFGVESIPNDKISKYTELLKDFNCISARELEGAKIINNLLSIEAQVVLDPTLLLDKAAWLNIASESNESNESSDYLLLYLISESNKIIKLARNIAKERNLKIIYLNNRLFKVRGMDNRRKTTIAEWLSLFMNANCVVTNSFHGLAFSVNFEKEFFVQYLPAPAKVNSRLASLLELLNLKERVIDRNFNIEKIDYDKVNLLLKSERDKSYDYIKEIISTY